MRDEAKIIPFSEKYRDQVRQVVLGVLEEYGFNYHPVWDSDLDRISEVYSGRSGFWVAIVRDTVVGTCALLEVSSDTAQLKRMYVLPAYRGKRIGLTLLQRVVDSANQSGFRKVTLDTTPTMTRAIELYERFGFEKAREEKGRVLYRLTLTGTVC